MGTLPKHLQTKSTERLPKMPQGYIVRTLANLLKLNSELREKK
jgi:hypothetical protein